MQTFHQAFNYGSLCLHLWVLGIWHVLLGLCCLYWIACYSDSVHFYIHSWSSFTCLIHRMSCHLLTHNTCISCSLCTTMISSSIFLCIGFFLVLFTWVDSLISVVKVFSFMPFIICPFKILSLSTHLRSAAVILRLPIHSSVVSSFCTLSLQYWSESIVSLCCGLNISYNAWTAHRQCSRTLCSICINVCMNCSPSFSNYFFIRATNIIMCCKKMFVTSISRCFCSMHLCFAAQLKCPAIKGRTYLLLLVVHLLFSWPLFSHVIFLFFIFSTADKYSCAIPNIFLSLLLILFLLWQMLTFQW